MDPTNLSLPNDGKNAEGKTLDIVCSEISQSGAQPSDISMASAVPASSGPAGAMLHENLLGWTFPAPSAATLDTAAPHDNRDASLTAGTPTGTRLEAGSSDDDRLRDSGAGRIRGRSRHPSSGSSSQASSTSAGRSSDKFQRVTKRHRRRPPVQLVRQSATWAESKLPAPPVEPAVRDSPLRDTASEERRLQAFLRCRTRIPFLGASNAPAMIPRWEGMESPEDQSLVRTGPRPPDLREVTTRMERLTMCEEHAPDQPTADDTQDSSHAQ